MAYDAQTPLQVAVFNTSPDAEKSGIWAGDAGAAADNEGNVFTATGNGEFDAATGGRDFGDSVLKLSLIDRSLVVRDYFTPYNQQELNHNDKDPGSGGPLLLPDQPGPHPHLMIVAGKGGTIYVIDRDRMGRHQEGSNHQAVQTLPAAPDETFGAPVYWNGNVYYLFSFSVLKDFAVKNGRLSPEPVAQASTKFINPGTTPTVSANGSRTAIVWVIGAARLAVTRQAGSTPRLRCHKRGS